MGEDIHLTEAEVSTAIKSLKAGKARDEDDIRPKRLKAMNNFGVCWLTRVCQIVWNGTKAMQTSELIIIHKIRDKKKCTNYRDISLLSLPGKVYAKFFEKRCREIVES